MDFLGHVEFESAISAVGTVIDVVGVAVIVVGAAIASFRALRPLLRRRGEPVYEKYRRDLGRSILLGLEFLVAADIIKTVAVAPTFTSVGVLALIVLIRTFLSFSLQLEITGRWPWQNRRTAGTADKQLAGE